MSALTSQRWGSWVLGDLADTITKAAALLGASQDVVLISAVKPESFQAPQVFVLVEDEAAVDRLKETLLRGEYVVDVYACQAADHWAARVAGLDLVIGLEAEAA